MKDKEGKNKEDIKRLLENKKVKDLISLEFLKAAHPIPSLDMQKVIAALRKEKLK